MHLSKWFWLFTSLVIGMANPGLTNAQIKSDDNSRQGPEICAVRQPVWCIVGRWTTILLQPLPGEAYGPVWTVTSQPRGDWKIHVLEPLGCRNGLSDTISIVKHDTEFSWHGEAWDNVVVRLKKDGSCDLQLLSSAHVIESSDSDSMLNKLELIRACEDKDCHGIDLNYAVHVPASNR